MIALSLRDAHAPPIRVVALHALAYCAPLSYLEELEQIRVADDHNPAPTLEHRAGVALKNRLK